MLASDIGDNLSAVTRFVLVSRTVVPAAPTGADKTTVIVELPDDRPGGLLEMLEQFSTRGINLGLIQSRPIGDALGRYRFIIDADGHVHDARMADALMGLRRFSPNVVFLGSYPRADRQIIISTEHAIQLRIFPPRLANQFNTGRVRRRLLNHHAIRHQACIQHRLFVSLLFDDSTFVETCAEIGNVAMPASNNGSGHLACCFKVIKTDGDIKAWRLAVHQFHHGNTRHFNHL